MSGLQKPENGKFSDPSICTAKTFFGTAFFVTVRLFCKTRRESVCDKEIERPRIIPKDAVYLRKWHLRNVVTRH